MDQQQTFYWHDYETFGTVPARDRPSQFAGLRTDADLNPIGEPLVIYCQPALEILPQPGACLVTGITPQLCLKKGLPERDFIARIEYELSQSNTCGVGYNSIKFDDEVTRYALYRNFYDPYQREWQNGNSRWDLINLMRMARALRPEGVNWTDHEGGSPSFRLEHLTAANGIAHTDAHDALADVEATIALARIVKQAQPKLWEFSLKLRDKAFAASVVNVQTKQPFVHVSGRLQREHLYTAVMMPLAVHPTNKNQIIAIDLSADPQALLDLPAEAIAERVFTSAADLPKGVERIPLKGVTLNRAPAVAPLNVLAPERAAELGIDLDRCQQHWQQLVQVQLAGKVQQVFAGQQFSKPDDADQQLYDGFISNSDKHLLADVRVASAEQLKQGLPFADARYRHLLFQYRARNFPASLTAEEQADWQLLQIRRLQGCDGYLGYADYCAELARLKQTHANDATVLSLLQQLEVWGEQYAQPLLANAERATAR